MNRHFADKNMFIIRRSVLMLILTIAVTSVHAQLADKKFTISFENISLREAFNRIGQAANVNFVYSEGELSLEARVSVNAVDKSLNAILAEVLGPQNISFRIYESTATISVFKTKTPPEEASNTSGTSVIRGKVTDAVTGENLAGVNILIKGTSTGTSTDVDGVYSISVTEKVTLIFSFIGYQSFETGVQDRTVIDVSLVQDSKSLNAVTVNAGYYEVEDKQQTGNIATVSAKQIASQPVINPLQAIQGRMAGVNVTQLTGIPGDGFTIQIRGVNSLRGVAANDPLYVIDGVPFSMTSTTSSIAVSIVTRANPLSSINPSDIESIEVLKDADATAIYGSRGSNGVVLITTKRGQGGKTKFDVDVYSGVGMVDRKLDMLNTSQYVQMRKEAFKNDGVTPTIANAPDLLLWDTTRYTNWQKMLIGNTAKITSAQASVSGGNSNTQFVLGGGYYRQTTVFPGDNNYQKVSGHFSLSHRTFNEKFTMRFTGNFVSDVNNLPLTDFTNLVNLLPPNAPAVYDANGSLNWENGTWANPIAETRKTYEVSTKNLITNAVVSYQILPGLSVKSSLGYNILTTRDKILNPIASQNPATSPLGFSILTNGTVNTWIVEPQLDFQRKIGEGTLSALVGSTLQQTIRDRQGVFANGFTNDSQLENLTAAATLTANGIDYAEYKYNAVYGRFNYTFRERYIVNLTARRDGSSRFGPNKQFANFGAVGAAWIFSKESFVSNSSPLSFGKIRASYGVTGSDLIGDYQYLDTYSSTTNTYLDAKGLIPTRLINPDFGWEQNRKLEAGLDLGFFSDRIFISASYYNNRSSNQLVGYGLPAITGFTTIQSNLPATIENSGFELVVNTVNIEKKGFSWKTSVNITIPRNRLLEYPNIAASSYANLYQVDKSLFIQKKYKSTGVDPATGLYTFQDVDNNGVLNSTADTQFIKERSIDYFGGLQNTLSYHGVELQFLFQFVQQTGLNYLGSYSQTPGTRANQPTYVLDRWKNPGDVASVQRFSQGPPGTVSYNNASTFGDASISDASFLRLQNASLSWTLPSTWSGKIKSERIRIYCLGQNLFTVTNYQGANPEGQSVRTLPPLRIITLGAQLTF